MYSAVQASDIYSTLSVQLLPLPLALTQADCPSEHSLGKQAAAGHQGCRLQGNAELQGAPHLAEQRCSQGKVSTCLWCQMADCWLMQRDCCGDSMTQHTGHNVAWATSLHTGPRVDQLQLMHAVRDQAGAEHWPRPQQTQAVVYILWLFIEALADMSLAPVQVLGVLLEVRGWCAAQSAAAHPPAWVPNSAGCAILLSALVSSQAGHSCGAKHSMMWAVKTGRQQQHVQHSSTRRS